MHDSTARRQVRALRESTRTPDDDERPERSPRPQHEPEAPPALTQIDGASLRALLVCQGKLRPAGVKLEAVASEAPVLRLDSKGRAVARRRMERGLRGEQDDISEDDPLGLYRPARKGGR